jgi:hypothetical protein
VLLTFLAAAVAVGGTSASGDPNLRIAQAFVAHRCAKASGPRDTTMWTPGSRVNALYGDCGGGDGRDQHIWFFVGHRFVGNDTPASSREIIGIWGDGQTLAFLYVLYRKADAMCCPTGGGKIVRFRWNGHRIVALDRIPPRQLGQVTVGR